LVLLHQAVMEMLLTSLVEVEVEALIVMVDLAS
jgi:hypothetical protein